MRAANPRSVWTKPPNSSKLYARTKRGPSTMNGIRAHPTLESPATPECNGARQTQRR